jgi:hypothetical protein
MDELELGVLVVVPVYLVRPNHQQKKGKTRWKKDIQPKLVEENGVPSNPC